MTQDHLPDAGKKVDQECEPFGYFRPEPFGWTDCAPDDEGAIPLYAAPPKREPLSEDEIKQIEFTVRAYKREPLDVVAFASAIERAHGIGGQS